MMKVGDNGNWLFKGDIVLLFVDRIRSEDKYNCM
jgi:hypothetical protein